jgi:hypothetical protein
VPTRAYTLRVGFLARDDEVPFWIHAWDFLWGLIIWLTMIGLGAAYLVIGKGAGQAVGAVLVVAGVAGAVWDSRQLLRRRDAS